MIIQQHRLSQPVLFCAAKSGIILKRNFKVLHQTTRHLSVKVSQADNKLRAPNPSGT